MKNKSNLYSDATEYGIVIKSKIEDGSKIGLSFSRDIAKDQYYAIKGDNYNADFGSSRKYFSFDKETNLKPYCKNNKLSAEYLGFSNGGLFGSGTNEDPYVINEASQFQEINSHPSSSFVVENDLNFSGIK